MPVCSVCRRRFVAVDTDEYYDVDGSPICPECVEFESSNTNYLRQKKAEAKAFFLFGNIGNKIKSVTNGFCCIGMIFSALAGIIMLVGGNIDGLLILLLGPLACWLTSLAPYALGELITLTQRNNQLLIEILKANRAQRIRR